MQIIRQRFTKWPLFYNTSEGRCVLGVKGIMNYAEIKTCDIANGPGVRVSLFVSGCTHRCKGCFNEIAWDFEYGKNLMKIR